MFLLTCVVGEFIWKTHILLCHQWLIRRTLCLLSLMDMEVLRYQNSLSATLFNNCKLIRTTRRAPMKWLLNKLSWEWMNLFLVKQEDNKFPVFKKRWEKLTMDQNMKRNPMLVVLLTSSLSHQSSFTAQMQATLVQ